MCRVVGAQQLPTSVKDASTADLIYECGPQSDLCYCSGRKHETITVHLRRVEGDLRTSRVKSQNWEPGRDGDFGKV